MHRTALPEKASRINVTALAVATQRYQTAAMIRDAVIKVSRDTLADFLTRMHALRFAASQGGGGCSLEKRPMARH
jgi:hypothetical protein